MINIGRDGWNYRMCGVDNGTDTVGVIVSDHNLMTGVSDIIFAKTLSASRGAYTRFAGLADNRGRLEARLATIGPFITDVCEEFDPDVFGIESPFSHLGIDVFRKLCKSMDVIDDAVYRYSKTLDFIKVPPGKAKKAACPPGMYVTKGPDKTTKEDIRRFILDNPKILSTVGIDLSRLDEHCIDGISVEQYLVYEASRAFS
jgi:Holliday junction resolvasome RuvABC endonuclease subunit